jgi:putative hemolysin
MAMLGLRPDTKSKIKQQIIVSLKQYMGRFFYLNKVNSIYSRLSGVESGQFLLRLLDEMEVEYEVDYDDLSRIPTTGPLVVMANHPFGGIEGIILASLLKSLRSDVKIMANYLLRCFPELHDICIFVDPFGRNNAVKTNIKPLREAIRWLENGGMVGIFPAGEVAHFDLQRREVTDPAWSDSVSWLIKKSGAAALPVFFKGANSLLFQLLGLVHPRLRTALLPHEFFNKQGNTISLKVGKVIPFEKLDSFASSEEMTAYLRLRTYILKGGLNDGRKNGNGPQKLLKRPVNRPIISQQNPAQINAEANHLPEDQTLVESGDFVVCYAHAGQIPNLLREIGRLREYTFRSSHEGTGNSIDLDEFDRYYLHLFIWNRKKNELVGAYRLGQTDYILKRLGKRGLYTSTLFKYGMALLAQINPALELGRSFVRPEYQKNYLPLLLLWKGISRFVVNNPQYKFLFGPVSINNEYHTISQQLMVATLKFNNYLPDLAKLVKPKNPYPTRPINGCDFRAMRIIQDVNEVSDLIADIEVMNKGIPILLKQYLRLGGKILGFNKDPNFSDVVDALILVDLTQTPIPLLERHMGKDGVKSFLAYYGQEKISAMKEV